MKNLDTLKKLINVFYIGLYILFYICITLAIALYFAGDQIDNIAIYGMEDVTVNAYGIMIFTAIGLSLYYYFILGIKALKDALPHITVEKPFNKEVSLQFFKAGKILVGVGIGYMIFNILTPIVLLSKLEIKLDHVTISGIFLVIIGLFFLFFSEAFTQAEKIKQENDLTI